MPYPSNSEVPWIELSQDGITITLYVRVDGFVPGTPVEISGYATQTDGAVATFYDIQEIPNSSGQVAPAAGGQQTTAESGQQTTAESGQGVILPVIAAAVPPYKFNKEYPIVVVTRAADVWITRLNNVDITEPPSQEIANARAILAQKGIVPGAPKAAWESVPKFYHSALYVPGQPLASGQQRTQGPWLTPGQATAPTQGS